jgi:hypothetical protein
VPLLPAPESGSMVSSDITPSLTLAELDSLIERDRDAAVRSALTLFRYEVAAAVVTIGEINQIANARVTAGCQVSSTKIKTDADLAAAILMSNAEVAILEVRQMGVEDRAGLERQKSVISGIGRESIKAIADGARETIDGIQSEAKQAIGKINQGATEAIGKINLLSMDIQSRITQCEEMAKENLDLMRREARSNEALIKQAEDATGQIKKEASMGLDELHSLTAEGIQGLNTATDKALQAFSDAAKNAERRIIEIRDTALQRITALVTGFLPE